MLVEELDALTDALRKIQIQNSPKVSNKPHVASSCLMLESQIGSPRVKHAFLASCLGVAHHGKAGIEGCHVK